MKSTTTKLLALAATLAIAAGTVSAQAISVALKAPVPFAFQAGPHVTLPAGDYRITRRGQVWSFTNIGTGEHSVVLPPSDMQGQASDTARLVFECQPNATQCTLRGIHAGSGEIGADWPAQKHNQGGAEVARVEVLAVRVSVQ
jgi:hypothetical protein